jgi:hypothetical protein
MTKEDMLALVRSVAVPEDVEQGMSHAYDLGVDWERARVEKILRECEVDKDVVNDVLSGLIYP